MTHPLLYINTNRLGLAIAIYGLVGYHQVKSGGFPHILISADRLTDKARMTVRVYPDIGTVRWTVMPLNPPIRQIVIIMGVLIVICGVHIFRTEYALIIVIIIAVF